MFRIPAFEPRRKLGRRVRQKEKFVLFDVGVRNALLGIHKSPVSSDQIGSVFEQWLILQVIYLQRALKKDWKISSYRTDGGAEVDLVVERGHGSDSEVMGIEIKASRNVDLRDLRGLKSLADTVGAKKSTRLRVAYLGEVAQRFDGGILALPFKKLLHELAAEF